MSEKIAEFKEQYAQLTQKYDLPELTEFDRQFGIINYVVSHGELPTFPLHYVRNRISIVYSEWISYLQGLISPNPHSVIALQHPHVFTEEQKEVIVGIIRKLMYSQTIGAKLNLERQEAQDAEYIKSNVVLWEEVVPQIRTVLDSHIMHWKKDLPKEETDYFG